MLKVSLDKCQEIISNRFELVMLAAARATKVIAGAPTTFMKSRNRPCLVALKEIEDKQVSKEELQALVINKHIDDSSKAAARSFVAEPSKSKESELDSLFSKSIPVQEPADDEQLDEVAGDEGQAGEFVSVEEESDKADEEVLDSLESEMDKRISEQSDIDTRE